MAMLQSPQLENLPLSGSLIAVSRQFPWPLAIRHPFPSHPPLTTKEPRNQSAKSRIRPVAGQLHQLECGWQQIALAAGGKTLINQQGTAQLSLLRLSRPLLHPPPPRPAR